MLHPQSPLRYTAVAAAPFHGPSSLCHKEDPFPLHPHVRRHASTGHRSTGPPAGDDVRPLGIGRFENAGILAPYTYTTVVLVVAIAPDTLHLAQAQGE